MSSPDPNPGAGPSTKRKQNQGQVSNRHLTCQRRGFQRRGVQAKQSRHFSLVDLWMVLKRTNHQKNGSCGQTIGGGGAYGAQGTKKASTSKNDRKNTDQRGKGDCGFKLTRRPVLWIVTDVSDAACCPVSSQRSFAMLSWRSTDACKIRNCWCCARCPCIGTVPCNRALDSTHFHCPLCRVAWGIRHGQVLVGRTSASSEDWNMLQWIMIGPRVIMTQ